jgi:hypothetical protein
MNTSEDDPASTSQTTLSPMENPSIRISRLSIPEEMVLFGEGLPFVIAYCRKSIAVQIG